MPKGDIKIHEAGIVRSCKIAHHKNRNLTVSVAEAQKIILASVIPLSDESISLMDASDRVLYEDVVSDVMIPPVDDSAMDVMP